MKVLMKYGEQAQRVAWRVFDSFVVLAVLVASAGVLAGKHDSPTLAAILLFMGAIAASAWASQSAIGLVIEASRSRRRRAVRRAVFSLEFLFFVICPLAMAVVAFWHAIRALQQ